jgi:hypothetical protein
MDRMQIAREFTAEKLQERKDIVAVLVSGSTSRGDALPISDIDLHFVCDVPPDRRMDREGFDEWREGIYLDAGPVPMALYMNTEKLLENLRDGNFVRDALILHDPSGVMDRTQREVKAAFRQPEWVWKRTIPLVDEAAAALRRLEEPGRYQALEEAFELSVIALSRTVSARLALDCVTRSSSRNLSQLIELEPSMGNCILELEGIGVLSLEDARSFFHDLWLDLPEIPGRYGQLIEYFRQKIAWMMDNGLQMDAAHWLWESAIEVSRFPWKSPKSAEEAKRIRKCWLSRLGWNPENLGGKIRGIRGVFDELESKIATCRH